MKQIFNLFRSNTHFSEQGSGAGDMVWKKVGVNNRTLQPGCHQPVASLPSITREFANIFARKPSSPLHPFNAADRLLAAEMMSKLKRGEDVRADKVARVADALNTDEYENDLKLDIAMMKLLEDLEIDPADFRESTARQF